MGDNHFFKWYYMRTHAMLSWVTTAFSAVSLLNFLSSCLCEMGDAHAVELAQTCHVGLALDAGTATEETLLSLRKPLPRSRTMNGHALTLCMAAVWYINLNQSKDDVKKLEQFQKLLVLWFHTRQSNILEGCQLTCLSLRQICWILPPCIGLQHAMLSWVESTTFSGVF